MKVYWLTKSPRGEDILKSYFDMYGMYMICRYVLGEYLQNFTGLEVNEFGNIISLNSRNITDDRHYEFILQ